MKNMKLTALCLSAAITLSTITAPVLASTDVNKTSVDLKAQISICLDKPDKSKDLKVNPGKAKFKFSDTENYLENMAWAIRAIERLGAKGIISGYTDKSYKPKNEVTNMEALSLILKLTNREEKSKKNDRVHSSLNEYQKQWNLKWGWGYLYVAVEEGILLKDEIKDFKPNEPIKRHELAKYLIRAIGENEAAEKNKNRSLDFKDADAVPKASRGYIYMINELGIMEGNDKDKFNPNETLTRAEIAVVIDKVREHLGLNVDDHYEEVIFVSYDNKNDTITVTAKGNDKAISYIAHQKVPLDDNGKRYNVNALKPGDKLKIEVVELEGSSIDQVISITVLDKFKDVDDDEDEDDEDDVVRKDVDFEWVEYKNLPLAIQKDVDSSLRATKGYNAYKYDNEIYLLAFMGKKSTGGYSIEIEDAKSYKLNGEYIIEAFVKETEPKSDSFVTQAMSYPYDVVKFDSFDNITKINFISEDGEIVVRRSIKDLDKETTATGVLDKIDSDYYYIEVLNDKVSKEYDLSEDVKVYINNRSASLKDLKLGMNVKLTLVNNKVTKILATYEVKKAKGIIQSLSTKYDYITVNSTKYYVEEDTVITVDGEESGFSELESGMKVTVELFNAKVTKIDAVNNKESYEGRIRRIEKTQDEVKSITLLVKNSLEVFTITEYTDFDMIDGAVPTDLTASSYVEINLLNGEVTDVIEIR